MGILDTVKDAITLVQKTDNIDLMRQLVAVQTDAVAMQEENRTLRDRVRELEQQLAFSGSLRFDAPLYFADQDPTPFCARCWEVDRRAIHLKSDWNGRRWECFQCHKVYLLDDSAKPAKPSAIFKVL